MTIYCLVGEGDSLTYASASYFYRALGGSAPRDPREASRIYTDSPYVTAPDRIIATNYAISGSRLDPHMLGRQSSVLALVPTSPLTGVNRPTRKWIISVLIGTNQDTADPAVHAANVEDYLETMLTKYDGAILGTLPSRMDGGNTSLDTGFIQPYNAAIKNAGFMTSYKSAGRLTICDFAADTEIGATGAASNGTYFSDLVHPTAAGQVIMAARFTTAITSAIAGLQ